MDNQVRMAHVERMLQQHPRIGIVNNSPCLMQRLGNGVLPHRSTWMTLSLFAKRRQLLGLMFGNQGGAKFVQVAIHDLLDLVKRQVDPVVRYPALRKIVGSDASGAVASTDQ